MRRILAPYGVNPKDLKQHLINIGFTPNKDKGIAGNDYYFLNNNIEQKKEMDILAESLDVVYKHYKYGDNFNGKKYSKDALQDKINYTKDCLVEPFDNGDINYDEISEGENNENVENDEHDENEEYWDYYDEYSHRRYHN